MDFTMERNLKKLKMTFWAKKSANVVLEYTIKCGIATFGGIISKKSSFCLYFHEKIMIYIFEIIMEIRYNLKNLKS